MGIYWGYNPCTGTNPLILIYLAIQVEVSGVKDDSIRVFFPRRLTAGRLKNAAWKTMLSFWNGPFSGDMLIFQWGERCKVKNDLKQIQA